MKESPENCDEIEEFRKKRRRGLIITGIAAVSLIAGISSVAAYACSKWSELRENVISAVDKENAQYEEEKRQQLEGIVSEIKTPEEAFARLESDIVFSPGSDIALYGTDRWSPMLETYSAKKGECEDGAIAFAAMLSDNPEYEVKVVYLKRDPAVKEPDHMIAVYQEKQLGTWGYVSFTEGVDATINPAVGFSIMENPLYGSIDSAVKEYCDESFVSYQIMDFTADDLKFGAHITRKFDSSAAIQLR